MAIYRMLKTVNTHIGCTCAGCVKLARLCVEDSMSLSDSSLPERIDVTLLVIPPAGPMEKNISADRQTCPVIS